MQSLTGVDEMVRYRFVLHASLVELLPECGEPPPVFGLIKVGSVEPARDRCRTDSVRAANASGNGPSTVQPVAEIGQRRGEVGLVRGGVVGGQGAARG